MRNQFLFLLCLLLLLSGCCRKAQEPENPVDQAIEIQRQKILQPTQATEPERPEEAPYESPIDFDALWEANPDICGWLDVPGCYISYPILRRDDDNAFYLNHSENGYESVAGCIFVENFNSRDLSDPALAIYGHHLRSGRYFGYLQRTFQTEEGFQSYRTINIYLPDRELHFRTFACVPYSDVHLLYTYNFAVPYEYRDFLEQVCSIRSFSARLDPEAVPEPGTQLVILSTCLEGDNNMRYLVIGAAED